MANVYTETLHTRWADNDIYGHMNNVAYYSFFDSTINRYLIANGLDIHRGDTVGFVVASECRYLLPVAYPDNVHMELRVSKLGNSSVTYALKLLNQEHKLAAEATITHVFVNRNTNKPTPIQEPLRSALAKLLEKPNTKTTTHNT